MKRSSARKFWQHYFTATQGACPLWLFRLSAAHKLQLLETVMQWEVTTPFAFKRPPRRHHV